MNRSVLFAGAAIVGVVAALVLYQQTSPSVATPSGPSVDQADEAPEPSASQLPTEGGGPRKQAVRGGERKNTEGHVAPEGKDPALAAHRDALLNSGFGKHSREAAPKYQMLSMQLKSAGAQELSDEVRVYSQELRQRRMEENVDKNAVLEKERALIQKVRDAGFGVGEVAGTLSLIEQLLVTYEADTGTPAEEPATDAQ